MTTQLAFLDRLIALLDKLDIPYMVAGSLGSSFYGRPRATQDVDIIVAPSAHQLESLIVQLDESGCYVSPAAARDALQQRTMFNVIDMAAGWKADLIVRKNRPFSLTEFQRRRRIEAAEQTLWIVSPEDAILSKLEWAQGRQSEVQHADALAVAVTHLGQLDLPYLDKWAKALGVEGSLSQLLEEARAQAEGNE